MLAEIDKKIKARKKDTTCIKIDSEKRITIDNKFDGKPLNIGEVSDGFHTYNELYDHRAKLFAVICYKNRRAWKSKKHSDGSMYPGMFIVGINTPDGPATYHYDIEPYWDLFSSVTELDEAPEWDGHTSEDAIARILSLIEGPKYLSQAQWRIN